MNKQSVGPHVMYETSALTEIPTDSQKEPFDEAVVPFELNEKNYSSLTRLPRVTAWALRFLRKL